MRSLEGTVHLHQHLRRRNGPLRPGQEAAAAGPFSRYHATRRLLGLLLPALLLAAGCGGTSKPVTVAGIVTLDGKPLAGATVTFAPVGGGRAASGRTDAEGNFQLTTFRSDDGALPGEYKVVVTMDKWDETLTGKDPFSLSEEEKTKLFMTMSPAGKKQAAELKKSSPLTVPEIYADAAKTPLKEVVPPAGKVQLSLSSKAR